PWYEGAPLPMPFIYVAGMWMAVFASIAFTAIYVFRVAAEARLLANALAATELVLQREQHLSALDGLAAAAAHELGTPLAT
ncbi:sensor histidine kinase, partial [Mesorhizobium sp. M2D.F.Ca.ET.140.01.1.1]